MRYVLFALTPALLLNICAAVLPAHAQNANLRQEIQAAEQRLATAMKQGDAAAIASMYTEDAQLLMPNAAPIRGRAAIASLPYDKTNIELETLEVEGQSDWAYELGAYTIYGDQGQVIDRGNYTVLWKKEDGEWKLHRDMVISSMPARASADQANTLYRANQGDEVGIATFYVRPNRKEAFERFVSDVLIPAARKYQPESSARVRLWTPAEPGENGTYPYAFVFDPFMEGGDYDIGSILEKVHGKERADQYMRDFETYYDSYTFTPFIQSK